jgi:hypothetical protein
MLEERAPRRALRLRQFSDRRFDLLLVPPPNISSDWLTESVEWSPSAFAKK